MGETDAHIMISLDEVNKTILELEQHDTTYATCEKLAWLYTVRDHINRAPDFVERMASPNLSGSEFLTAASNKDVSKLLEILDEHVDVVKLLHPSEYESLIQRIKEIEPAE